MKQRIKAISVWKAVVLTLGMGLGICSGQDINPLLRQAGTCTVFQLRGAKVSMSHGDPTGVDGDLCLGPGTELSMSGGQIVTGAAFLDPLVARVPADLAARAGSIQIDTELGNKALAAETAAGQAAGLVCDVTMPKLRVDRSVTFDASSLDTNWDNNAVFCVGDMEVTGSGTVLSLRGGSGASFTFNVQGSFKVNGAKIMATDGVTPGHVLYNLMGPGPDASFTGGGGGIGCCKAAADGTILASARKITLSPGRVNGQLISGKDITLSSGSLVSRPDSPVIEVPQ